MPLFAAQTGSLANLVGSEWVREVQTTLNDQGITTETKARTQPLRVGGVGKGSQSCHEEVTIPLAMARHDGSVKGGTFSAPVISGSSAPALLGLRSLTEHRAILDLVSNQIHLLGPGEARLELPEGSETFNLERAPTGHLMLPFQQYAKLTDQAQGVRHLFTESEAGYMAVVAPTGEQATASDAQAVPPTAEDAIPKAIEVKEEASEIPTVKSENPEQAMEEVQAAEFGEDAGPTAVPPAEATTEDILPAAEPEMPPSTTPTTVEPEKGEAPPAPGVAAPSEAPPVEAGSSAAGEAVEEAVHGSSTSPMNPDEEPDEGDDERRQTREWNWQSMTEVTASEGLKLERLHESRHQGDLELPLDEIAGRMGLPSERALLRQARDEDEKEPSESSEPKQVKKKRRRRQKKPSEEEYGEEEVKPTKGAVDEAATERGRLPPGDTAPDQPPPTRPRSKSWASEADTTPYSTDREAPSERSSKVDKSFVALPSDEKRSEKADLMKAIMQSRKDAYPVEEGDGGPSGSRARPAEPKGKGKSKPPAPPPPKRAMQMEGKGKEKGGRTPPTPPKPKRLTPPPEPAEPPRYTAAERENIREAETALAAVMANPYATRTAKRKARGRVREAKGEPPPN